MFGDEIDRLCLGTDVFTSSVDPDIGGHDFVIWLWKSHIAIENRFIGIGCACQCDACHFVFFV